MQGSTPAGPGAHAQQVFSASIQVRECAIRFKNEDGRIEAAENVRRERRRIDVSR